MKLGKKRRREHLRVRLRLRLPMLMLNRLQLQVQERSKRLQMSLRSLKRRREKGRFVSLGSPRKPVSQKSPRRPVSPVKHVKLVSPSRSMSSKEKTTSLRLRQLLLPRLLKFSKSKLLNQFRKLPLSREPMPSRKKTTLKTF